MGDGPIKPRVRVRTRLTKVLGPDPEFERTAKPGAETLRVGRMGLHGTAGYAHPVRGHGWCAYKTTQGLAPLKYLGNFRSSKAAIDAVLRGAPTG